MHYSPHQFRTVTNSLINEVLTREFSAYKSSFLKDITWETEHKYVTDGDGYLVTFKSNGVTDWSASFTYLNGSDRDLEAYVREAVVRIIRLSNI